MPSVFITGKEHRFPLHLTQLKFALTSIINYASTILFELVTASPFPAPLLILWLSSKVATLVEEVFRRAGYGVHSIHSKDSAGVCV